MEDRAGEERRLVLVVDDEMHLRLFIGAVFETAGFRTLLARDGAEGLQKAREARPDLISLDLMMPNEGGIRMFKELKADESLRRVPVMIVSAVGGATFDHALEMLRVATGGPLPGPEAYVEKPPKPEALLAAAGRLLGGG